MSEDPAYDMFKELDRLRAENERLRAKVEKWECQPIETAPKDVKWLLTWDGSHYHIATRLGWTGMTPTHWMPLPDPPQETEG